MAALDIESIISCLSKVAKILHHKPEQALKELRAISREIDKQVPYRDCHNLRVTKYSLQIGEKLKLSDKDMLTLEAAALLHDFGKIGIDESLLVKPTALARNEKAEIENHVLRGYYILSGFEELEKALEGVRNHHEHYNGTGYPRGAKGTSISLFGRIIAVADAYDAMTSKRPYREAMTKKQAIAELKRCSGSQFDPEIVEVFIKTLGDID